MEMIWGKKYRFSIELRESGQWHCGVIEHTENRLLEVFVRETANAAIFDAAKYVLDELLNLCQNCGKPMTLETEYRQGKRVIRHVICPK